MPRQSDLDTFYWLLDDLEARVGGRRRLAECHGRLHWPRRGVYFFFEPGEHRDAASTDYRVVRVGTHALTSKSRTTLWKRLGQHRGTTSPPGGNHRGSIFRLLVGEALLNRDASLSVDSWGQGSSASGELRAKEREHEMKVSEYLGGMTLLFVDVPDDPGRESGRGILERNSIALLSSYVEPTSDQPSSHWLGHRSGRERVRRSGLWNNNHVDEAYDPGFLDVFEEMIAHTQVG
ncbi:hypothetical protein EF888_07160 [Silicimonas algicola]|uniref:GIY-YIG domain-containing protein n=1 Tax=Silicimonas algicola TaxID=1826607 RepID=A0A316GJZ8_9RHOB|nr:hypothetical protein EF888_07160 [Silicimonas algicola]PWK55147.1 hypothetical protein C8D95_10822 [Silicimonas algicola]